MIQDISQPIWDKDKRVWSFYYTIVDKNMGKYKQVVETETLLSAENYIKFIKGKMR